MAALKTQTPIVAKPTEEARTIHGFSQHSVEICIFNKFIFSIAKKGYSYPPKIKIALAQVIQLVWQIHYTTAGENCKYFSRFLKNLKHCTNYCFLFW